MTGSFSRLLALGMSAALGLVSIDLALPRSVHPGGSPSGKLSIDAILDRDHIAAGESATLTVLLRCEGLGLPEVSLPPLPGVTVERTATAQNFSMINGRVERTSTTVYRLTPRPRERRSDLPADRTVQIPPLRVSAGGEEASTSPLTLIVRGAGSSQEPQPSPAPRAPGGSPARTPELFVKATVDRPHAYWNQQVVLRLRLYSRVDVLGDVDWKPPSTGGFWSEGLGPPRQERVRWNGTEYAMMEIPTALFPTRTGRLTIGSGQIRCRVARVEQPPDPWSMLAIPNVIPEEVVLRSDPITVMVDPLPPGAPAGFQGAVGNFELAVRADRRVARSGEPIIARATIRGAGNIPTVREPEIRAAGAARQYVAGSATRMDRSGDRIAGERSTDVAFVVDQPGELTILPVRFAWFDPEAGRYRSQASDTVRVRVLAGNLSESEGTRPLSGGPPPAAPRRSSGPMGSVAIRPPAGSVVLLGFSLLAYAGGIVTGNVRRRRARDPRQARQRSLDLLLAHDMMRAEALAREGQPAQAAALAEEILRTGTGLRFDVDLAGLSRVETLQVTRQQGADEKETGSLDSLFEALERIAYAPPDVRDTDAAAALREVTSRLGRYRGELA